VNTLLGPYEQRIAAFYNAFRELDAKAMTAAYAPDARFRDPVFDLHGRDEIGAMWSMLCEAVEAQGRDVWRLDVSAIAGDASRAHARWEPRYRFSATGRTVHNVIDAEFGFDDYGLIVAHRDQFDFWRWSRQALGPVGWALGWSPWLRARVAAQARAALAKRMRAPRQAPSAGATR
jgi:ketosteroid isomerase-like protein